MSITIDSHTETYGEQDQQRRCALERANAVRIARATYKRDLAARRSMAEAWRAAAELIAEPPPELVGMNIRSLLLACRKSGPQRVDRLLRFLGIGHGFTVGSLTERQRAALLSMLRIGSEDRHRSRAFRDSEFHHPDDVVRTGAAW